jgi:hypothetical protein
MPCRENGSERLRFSVHFSHKIKQKLALLPPRKLKCVKGRDFNDYKGVFVFLHPGLADLGALGGIIGVSRFQRVGTYESYRIAVASCVYS